MTSHVTDAIASSPPVAVAGMTFYGYGVADWVQVAALVWIIIQIGWWAYKNFIKKEKD
jgi:hypothetical protein